MPPRSLRLTLGLLALAGLAACGTPGAPSTLADARTGPAAHALIEARDILRRPLAADMVELAHSPRQRAVFVSAPDWKDESRSAVLRLDPNTLDVQARIPLDGKGFGVALDDAGGRLYLTQGFNGAITVVDTGRNRVLKRIPVMEKVDFRQAYAAHGLSAPRTAFLLEQLKKFGVSRDYPYKLREMVLDSRTDRLFAPGLGLGFDSVLFVIDTRTLELEKIVPGFGYNAVGIALDEAGGRVFVSNMRGQVMTVDARTLEITRTLEVQADQLLNLAYDARTNRLFGVDQGIDRDEWRNNHLEREYRRRSPGHRVFALDADTGRTLADMPAGEVPIALRHDARRHRLYVTNRGGVRPDKGAGSITVYDTDGYRLLQTLPMPPHPNGLALDEARGTLYATIKNDGERKKAGEPESVVRIAVP
ncbi:YncE family protein [Castellaniella defragrans]|uniref:DNA-binding beta-propeller fold protein YncE n=1 Tax=Castellaniella defragrans TaxID=75697 RepID=A0A7W9WML1_CASDE|nr:hypothetical protein [Castellaniella defragrans]MBB6082608.1 DNA-binding beta-propeller fold protein YncE [Castellaniella defragrans]